MNTSPDKKNMDNSIFADKKTEAEKEDGLSLDMAPENPAKGQLPPAVQHEMLMPEKSMADVFGQAPVSRKKPMSTKIIQIIAILILLLAVAAVYLKGEELGFLRPKPEKVLAQMLQNAKDLKTAHTETEGTVAIANSAKPGQTVNIDFKMSADENSVDEKNPKVSLNYDLNLAMEGMSFAANFDLTVADKIAYLKLNKAPMLPFIDFGKLKGKWVKIDPQEMEKLNPLISKNLKNAESSEELNAKIMQMLEKYQGNLISVKKELPDESVNGVNVYSYAISLDKNTFRQLINEIMAIGKELNKNNLSASALKEMESEEYKNMQEKVFGAIVDLISNKADIKILVGKKDKMMHGLSVSFNLTGKELGELAANMPKSVSGAEALPKELEKLTFDFNFDITYSNFNKPVEITAPEKAEDFMKALGMEESLGAARKKANDAKRTSDLQQLKAGLALYQDDNGIYPATKGIEKTGDKNGAIYKLAPKYIFKIPVDPLDPNYYYGYKSDGKSFELTARAEETTSNPGKCNKINENLCLITVKDK